MPRTNIYIDGFNFYYGAVRHTPYKWLDFARLCQLLLPPPQFAINQIKYFTARVQARPNDPDQPVRQDLYLRALRTIPNLSVIFGHFLTNECSMPLAGQNPLTPAYVRVVKTEEKGSDVNLATHLVNDGHNGDYEVGVIISNDSDLVEPVRIVTHELRLQVGILNPHQRRSRELSQYATFYKKIRPGVLAASQFPSIISDATGNFHKPPVW
jgi:NYN domain-containing protein